MTSVLHVLGRAAPGDVTTAAARALCRGLAAEGVAGRLAAVEVRGACDDVDVLRPEQLADTVVVAHTVDGGESLAPIVDALRRARVHVVHHGSRPGSDRTVLRSLRGTAAVAAAPDAAAREELRGLGFGDPVALPSALPADARAEVASGDGGEGHPGPYLLTVGPIAEGRSLELLVDAFAQLLEADVPSAVLSVCGPADRWYLDALLRRVVRRGLLACEVIEPRDEDAVRSRLARCDVYVALQPGGYDPYLHRAADRATVVAPTVAATASFVGSPGFVGIGAAPTRDHLTGALRAAVAARPAAAAIDGRASRSADLRALLRVA